MQRSVDKLRSEYLDKLDALDTRMSTLEPVYRWPLPYDEVLNYQCLYASGGGSVRPTGGLPQTRQEKDPKLCRWGFALVLCLCCLNVSVGNFVLLTNDVLCDACLLYNRVSPHILFLCSTVFKWYFAETAGQYWKDLDLIGKDATAFLTNTNFTRGDSSNIVIFDIDETLLSNITPYPAGYLDDDSSSSNSDQKHREGKIAPALQAIKDVYLAAYSYGMSVRSPHL